MFTILFYTFYTTFNIISTGILQFHVNNTKYSYPVAYLTALFGQDVGEDVLVVYCATLVGSLIGGGVSEVYLATLVGGGVPAVYLATMIG